MPATRLSRDEQMALALDELEHLGSLVDGVSIERCGPDQVRFQFDDGAGWAARVFTYDSLDEAHARQLVERAPRGRKVVVANRITESARHYLSSHRWAWVDRRIGAHIPGREVFKVVYASERSLQGERAPFEPRRPAADGPIRGRAGIAYAAALLCTPSDPPSLREVAREVAMSPTSVSNAARRLADAGLIGPGTTPSVPDLFWALAEVWAPLKTCAVARAPEPLARGFATNVDQLDQPGWVLGGDLAAAALGAPLFSVERRPWLWVPTQVELRRARRAFESAPWDERAATIAVPPTPLVTMRRGAPMSDVEWPLPHPVFAALDLARDPGRGREILDQWMPEGVEPVWQ